MHRQNLGKTQMSILGENENHLYFLHRLEINTPNTSECSHLQALVVILLLLLLLREKLCTAKHTDLKYMIQ